MQVPKWDPLAFRQSIANMHTPSWPDLLDMHGRCLMFLANVTGPAMKETNFVSLIKFNGLIVYDDSGVCTYVIILC